MPANATTRHAVCRSTGSTTLALKQEDGSWNVACLNHGATATASSRGEAWKVAPKPEGWCPKCKAIAAGKADKPEDGLLDTPAPTAAKKATTKSAKAKSAVPTKGAPAKAATAGKAS